ncbi:MAG: UDP-glucose 4-epimerase [Chloroflexi bacterium]|nr:MAG: UDP-glucose 4-epimerase [Chloroflexota bacterium]
MNILITGAGLVGCYLARDLIERGHNVVLYELAPYRDYIKWVAGDVQVVAGDVREMPDLVETMKGNQIEVVVHTVALMGQKLDDQPYRGMNINIGGTINVVEAARLTGVERLVYTSTFGVYHWNLPPTEPVTEEYVLAGNVLYSGSKIAAERIVRAYGNRYGISTAVTRFANVYGAGHYAGGAGGGLGASAIHELVDIARKGGDVSVDPRRLTDLTEYVYIKDAVRGVALAAEQKGTNQTFNLGTGVLATPEDVAEAFKKAFPSVDVRVMDVPGTTQVTHRDQPLDLTHSRNELGYDPQFVDLADGIADFSEELAVVPVQAS